MTDIIYYRSKTNGYIAPHDVWIKDIQRGYITLAHLEPIVWFGTGEPNIKDVKHWIPLDEAVAALEKEIIRLTVKKDLLLKQRVNISPNKRGWNKLKEWSGVKL